MSFDRLCFATGGYMDIRRAGSQPSGKGPADWFTGIVRIDPLFQAPDPARVAGASVTFEPGARTAWHSRGLDGKGQRRGVPGGIKSKLKRENNASCHRQAVAGKIRTAEGSTHR